ncbi:MAG TPA: hypothetical protein VNF05_11695 [Acidimicrobiales bacterium]|nr:hypothetical protein [Acidimicrobiales bacterium]
MQKTPARWWPSGPRRHEPLRAALAKMLMVAQCIRRHGVAQFPEPKTSVPSPTSLGEGGGFVSDRDGVILIFPGSLNTRPPTFGHAAAACQFARTNH